MKSPGLAGGSGKPGQWRRYYNKILEETCAEFPAEGDSESAGSLVDPKAVEPHPHTCDSGGQPEVAFKTDNNPKVTLRPIRGKEPGSERFSAMSQIRLPPRVSLPLSTPQ